MTLKEEMLVDIAEIENDMGLPTFTWKGGTYPCVAGSAANLAVLTEGGMQVNLDLALTVRQNVFTGSLPRHQERVTYRGEGFRVYEVHKDVTTAYIRLLLISDTKGL